MRAAFFGFTLLAALPATAGTTWDGGGANASWGTFANWNPDGLPLFNGTETITIGTAFTSGSTLTLDGNRNIGSLLINTTTAFTIATGTGGSLGIYSGNITRQDVTGTEGTHTISANVVLGDPTGAAAYSGTWSIDGANSLDVSGVISEAGGSRGITKTGAATLTLSGANTYTGTTTINAGTVTLDYTTVGSKLADTSILALGGGTLNLANGASAHNEVVASTTINSGGSSVTRTSGTSVLRMNVITRNAGGTIDFGAANIADTDTSNTNGILGGWATVAGADWAVSATSAANTAITALASYTAFGTSSATTNQIITSSGLTTTGGTYAANSLKIAPTGSGILILNGPSGKKLTITSGGILFVGSSDYTISATVGGNTLLGASNGELIVQQFSTGNLTISAIIADNGTSGLIKAGTGTLTLSGANSYTGLTTVSAGTLAYGASDVISTGGVTVSGSTAALDLGANQTDTVGTVTVDGGGSITGTGTSALTSTGTFEMKSGSVSAILAGSAIALNKTTTGTVTLSGANTYTGATTVSAGSLFVNGSTASASAVTVNNSGTTLGGSGTINGSINVASSGANLSPGASGVGSTAILHTGTLTLSSGSNLNVDLNNTTAGTGYDQASVIGAVSISGSNIVVTAGASLSIGDKFFILLNDSNDAVTGTFAQGATVTSSSNGDLFSINYADNGDGGALGNDISLTVTAVPEPATYAVAVLTLGALAFHQRRRLFALFGCSGARVAHKI